MPTTIEKIIVLGHNSTTSTQIWEQDPSSGLWTLLYNHSGVGTALRSSVVGCSGGQIIASIQGKPHHYEGGVWTEKDAISGFAFRLHAANSSYNAVWALCYPSGVYTAIWDGSAWGPSRYCATAAMDLWAASATEAWVVGTSAILHTTDGGVNWTNLYSQAQSETGINIPVYCVYGWNANEVYFLGHGGSYGASGTRSKLIRWNGANFSSVTMDIIRLDHPTVGHNPPVYGTAGQFWFELWPSYFNQGYCRQFWGISSSQVVLTASEWSWNGWTWNGSVCEEREYVGSSWGTGQPRIAGLSNTSRIVSVPRGTTAGVVAKETSDGGVTWHAVDASFPASLTYKDIGLLYYTTVDPSIDEQDPHDAEYDVPIDHTVHFHIHKGSGELVESTILIQLNGVDVWKFGAQQPGFTVVKDDIADGFSFLITPDDPLIINTVYAVRCWAENDTDEIDESWTFTTVSVVTDPLCSFGKSTFGPNTGYGRCYWEEGQPVTVLATKKIESVFVVAKDVITVIMTVDVVNDRFLRNILNYSITNMSGGGNGKVIRVLPTYAKATIEFSLYVTELKPGQTYKLTIKDSSIFGRDGVAIPETSFTWLMRQTKVDMAIRTFANLYSKKIGSRIRSLIEAIMINDEKIGGDY